MPTTTPVSAGEGGDTGADTTGMLDTSTGEPTPVGTPASGIELTDLLFNQGVTVPIARDGEHLPPDERDVAGNVMPTLVAGRGGLFRAQWETEAGWSPREIEARLILTHPDGTMEALSDVQMVDDEPDLSEVDGTFRWKLTGEQVQAGTEYSVALYETMPGNDPAVVPPRIPAEGSADLGVPDDDLVLELVFIPVTVGGVAPNLSPDNVEKITNGYFDMSPAREVIVTVRDGISIGNGNVDDVLDATIETRSADNPPSNVYYVGFAASSKIGWSGVASFNIKAAGTPLSEVVNFPNEDTLGFAVHETGHNQKMEHTPGCGAGGTVNNWPFPGDTTINTQGYGIRADTLYAGDEFQDVMNYCTPDWPSVYTWEKVRNELESLAKSDAMAWAPRTMTLQGLVRSGESGRWWAVPQEDLAVGDSSVPIQVDLRLSDGSLVEIGGYQHKVHDRDLVSIDAKLPVSVDEIYAIEVHLPDRSIRVDPSDLTSFYDGLVAGEHPVLKTTTP